MKSLVSACFVVALSGCGGAHHAGSAGGGDAGAGAGGASGGHAGAVVGASGGVAGGSGGFVAVAGTSGGIPAQAGFNSGGNGASVGMTGGASAGGHANGGGSGAASAMMGGAPAGGASPAGGDAPGGMGGEPPMGGAGGSVGTRNFCSFAISASLSPDMVTVGLVDWSTDLKGVSAARIEFTLDDPAADELNVGSGGPISTTDSRALMLGLKPGRSYTYRIVATAGSTDCVSADHKLVTQTDPKAPVVTKTPGTHAASRSNGFLVTCGYSGINGVLILDTDGAVVWWTAEDLSCTQAHMSWDGQYMWMMEGNPTYASLGDVRRVRLDGSGTESILGLEKSHHDFAVLPDGTTAYLVWDNETSLTSDLVERAPDGTLHTLTVLDKSTLNSGTSFHTNSLRYYARDDTYSLTDLSTFGVYKFSRQGTLLWSSVGYGGIHGHQLLANGNLLYFQAHYGSDGSVSDPSPVFEFSFAGQGGTQTATQVWTYGGTAPSVILGDVWRRPNGNTIVTYSTSGTINEVTPAGELLQSLDVNAQLGYSDFRETLYGPPLLTP